MSNHSQLARAAALLEALCERPEGVALQELADTLEIPKSATHRLLSELMQLGFVRQEAATAHYGLSTRLLSMAFRFLAASGVADVAQPIMDRLAGRTGELVRLGVVDGDTLTWVAKAQGARSGLRYDPDMGREAPLSCTASGHAWLAALSNEEALRLVSLQGFARPENTGPNAPRTVEQLLACLARARELGYAAVTDSSAPGVAALAVAVRHPASGRALGVLSVAGPSMRLTDERMREFAPLLLDAARELEQASAASTFFARQGPAPAAPSRQRAA